MLPCDSGYRTLLPQEELSMVQFLSRCTIPSWGRSVCNFMICLLHDAEQWSRKCHRRVLREEKPLYLQVWYLRDMSARKAICELAPLMQMLIGLRIYWSIWSKVRSPRGMGKLSLVGEYLTRTRHQIFHLMGKVKHLLPHFLTVCRDFQARIHQCSPEDVEVVAGVSVSLDRQTDRRRKRKKKYVKIRGGGRRLGGPQTGSRAFKKRRNMLILPGIKLWFLPCPFTAPTELPLLLSLTEHSSLTPKVEVCLFAISAYIKKK